MLPTGRPFLMVSTQIQRRMGHSLSGSALARAAALVHLQVSLDGAVVWVAVGGLVASIVSILIA